MNGQQESGLKCCWDTREAQLSLPGVVLLVGCEQRASLPLLGKTCEEGHNEEKQKGEMRRIPNIVEPLDPAIPKVNPILALDCYTTQ